MSDKPETLALIASIAGAIGLLIKAVADALGEPLEDVRKRVLAQVQADAADPSDETDEVLKAIEVDLPSVPSER